MASRRAALAAAITFLLMFGGLAASAQSLVSALLPTSRSVQTSVTATVFATIINADSATATGCQISLLTAISGTFAYQTTDPLTNQLTGTFNTPADIAAGAA